VKYLLSREGIELLGQIAWSRALIAFDFDGTLAPIVEARDRAAMRASTQRLFSRVCLLYPCAVISGRSRADMKSRLAGAHVKYSVGNHGLEPGTNLSEFQAEIAEACAGLQVALAGWSGIEIEDKRYSLAVHYRRARRKQDARDAIRAAIEALPVRTRMIPGKLVVSVLPADAPNKASALLELRSLEQADIALYVGDDVTDEDVFQIDEPGRVVSVRIGAWAGSAAMYFLREQAEVDLLLSNLVELRERRSR
jgi:trehalose 6-phosphate phosphatase